MYCRQGVHNFLRAYYHHKLADFKGNKPHRLAGWTAEELAKMPTYYIMDLFDDMPASVGKEMPSAAEIAADQWLTEAELAVYAGEWQRTGIQGGLNWYRSRNPARLRANCSYLPGADRRAIGLHRRHERLGHLPDAGGFRTHAGGLHPHGQLPALDGAGHWVQQEQAEQVIPLLLDFLRQQAAA